MRLRADFMHNAGGMSSSDISSSGLSFGMGPDSPSIALGGPMSSDWFAPGSSSAVSASPAALGSSGSGIAATNLPGVTVNAAVSSLPGMTVSANAPSSSGATNLAPITVSGMPHITGPSLDAGSFQIPGVPVTNMSPVNVTAQAPSGFLGTLANFKADHPALYQGANIAANLLTGGLTTLPSMVVNAYLDHMNGKGMLGSLLPPGLSGVGGVLDGMFNAMGNHGGGGTVQQANTGILGTLPTGAGSSMGANGSGGAGGISTGAPLPDYAGLGALGNFGSAPVGGYWNQQALKMASPTYGPYAGYGGATPQLPNYANPYAPSGITTAGY